MHKCVTVIHSVEDAVIARLVNCWLTSNKKRWTCESPGDKAEQGKPKVIENRWRRGAGSNRRIKVLQTSALPLGYRALKVNRSEGFFFATYRAAVPEVNSGITGRMTRDAYSGL